MRKIIVDCDPGMDDSSAIIMAVKNPNLDIQAVTTVNGNYPVDITYRNARRIMRMLGREDIPVYRGCSRPLVRDIPNDPFTHGRDGQGESFLPDSELPENPTHAVNAIIDLIRQQPGEITLVCLAPMTNIAMALRLAPDIKDKIVEVIAISGAFGLNEASFLNATGDTPQSEWNVYVDPRSGGRPVLALEHRRERGMAALSVLDGAGDDLLRDPGGLERGRALGELGGDRRGQGAAGAGDAVLPDLRAAQLDGLRAVVEHVHGVGALEHDAALGQHDHAIGVVDAAGRLGELLDGLDALHPRQRERLEVVGGDERGQRQDLVLERIVRVQGRAGLLPLADQHRVQHHMGEAALGERGGDGVDGRRGAEHADLHGVDVVRGGGRLDLVRDHLRVHRDEAVRPVVLRIEGDDAGQGRGAEGAELLERLQVGLRAGASGGLGAGDRALKVT